MYSFSNLGTREVFYLILISKNEKASSQNEEYKNYVNYINLL